MRKIKLSGACLFKRLKIPDDAHIKTKLGELCSLCIQEQKLDLNLQHQAIKV
jgi:hypothetical protein